MLKVGNKYRVLKFGTKGGRVYLSPQVGIPFLFFWRRWVTLKRKDNTPVIYLESETSLRVCYRICLDRIIEGEGGGIFEIGFVDKTK